MARLFIRWGLALNLLILGASVRAGTTPMAAGAIGDSLAAEYQFSVDPNDRQWARNFVELLAENAPGAVCRVRSLWCLIEEVAGKPSFCECSKLTCAPG